MKKQSISLCMIVKNEETHLQKCLESAMDQVDEIIIVDTGSTDSTIEIARNFTTNIYEFEWVNDFSAARNYAISKATKDYILVLDADEYLDDSSNLQIDLQKGMDHYTVRIRNHLTSGGIMFHPAVRLFKNNIGFKYFGSIHEHLNTEDPQFNFSHAYAKHTIIHHVGYHDEIVKEKNKHNRNLTLLLDEVHNNPTGYNYFNLGNQYKAMDDFEKALEAYQAGFQQSKDRMYINLMLYHIADCLRQLKRYEEAIEVIDGSIESFPYHTDFYFMKGRIFEELGLFGDAEQAFTKCIELGEVDFVQSLEGVGSYLSLVRLGNIHLERGEMVKSFEMASQALNCNKHHMPALRLYIEILIKTRIPIDNIREQLKMVYPIKEIDDLKTLIIVLAVVKSPLLIEYINQFNMNVDPSVLAIANQYSGNFKRSKELWIAHGQVEKSEVYDLLLLSYILQDQELLELVKPKLNLNKKEMRQLKGLIERENITLEKASVDFENIVLFFTEQLLVLNQEDGFNYLLVECHHSVLPVPFKVKMARSIYNFGYYNIARDIALVLFENNQNNKELLILLGDICIKQNLLDEALSFYLRSLSFGKSYLIYEKVFSIFKKKNDNEKALYIKKEIKSLFPLTQWVLN